jgi:quinol monooxygenase YgiN
MTVVVVAEHFGIAGRRNELHALLATAEREARAGDGCLRYTYATSLDDHDHVVLVSEWRDQPALDAHYASPSFARFQFDLHGLLSRPSITTHYQVSQATRPVASGPMDPRDAD